MSGASWRQVEGEQGAQSQARWGSLRGWGHRCSFLASALDRPVLLLSRAPDQSCSPGKVGSVLGDPTGEEGGKAAAHPEARPVLCRLLEQLRLQPPCLMVQSQQDTPAWAASLMTPKAVYGVIVGLIGGGRPHCSPATWGLASLCDQEILLLWFF